MFKEQPSELPSTETPESPELSERELIEKFGLEAGKSARFEKVSIRTKSAVPVGSIVAGLLAGDVEVGRPITFKNDSSVVSPIERIWEENGELHFETSTSEYKLRVDREAKEDDEILFHNIAYVVTERGSVYKYLDDGTTQRYKEAEKSLRSPKDVLVFVPDFDLIKDKLSAEELAFFGKDGQDFEDVLLEYIHGDGKVVDIVNSHGDKLETNGKILSDGGDIFLAFGDVDKIDFRIPVSHMPKIGYSTFDKTNTTAGWRRHMGNRVSKIVMKS